MKKLTSILLLLLFVWTVQAQTAREEIRANRYLSAVDAWWLAADWSHASGAVFAEP